VAESEGLRPRTPTRPYADTPTRSAPADTFPPLPAPRSLNIRVSSFANLSRHIAFGFYVLGLEPREVTYQIVKNKDLPVAFRA
jgi:hypothetical protein